MIMCYRNILLGLFVFAAALMSGAQDDFTHGGLDLSKYHISHLQSHMHPSSEMFDGVKVERIIGILRGNLEQWGFIEGQLMEPDVNLKMPEILIPLRHLTTTLEVLGNIFFVKGEICEARCFLERACPLLELLPLDETTSHRSASSDCYGVLSDIYYSLYNTASGALNLDGGSGDALNETKTFPEICDSSNADECSSSAMVDRGIADHVPRDGDDPDGTYRPCTCPNSDDGLGVTTSLDNIGFDLAHQLESLRSPYEHLRDKTGSEIPSVDFSSFGKIGESNNNGTKRQRPTMLPQRDEVEPEMKDLSEEPLANDDDIIESNDDGMHGNPHDSSGEHVNDLPKSGLSSVMWKMLQDFVREDDYGRREILHQSRQHYAELHSSVEEFNTEEVVSRLATADAYLAIMHKATHEGFAFIDRELREYRSPTFDRLSHNTVLDEDFVSIHGELSPGESARLVVLTAFDRALTEGEVSREPERQRKGDKKRGKLKASKKNFNPFPDQPISDPINEEESMESGEENISTTVVLLFIVAISITLYISFIETNKRRHQRVKSRGSSGKEFFESICEWAYLKMERGLSGATEKKVETGSTSEKKSTKDGSAKKKVKKAKKEPKAAGVKGAPIDSVDKSTDEDDAESDEMSDDDIEPRVFESTDFTSGGATKSEAYEEKPEEGDDFLNEESIFRDVDPSVEAAATAAEAQPEPVVEEDPIAVAAEVKKAISDAEKAKKKAERKEKERQWKKEQREKRAMAKLLGGGAAVKPMPPPIGVSTEFADNGLAGLLGKPGMGDSAFNVDLSYNLGDSLDLGGVVGRGEPMDNGLSDFKLNDDLLPGLMPPGNQREAEGTGLSFGLPNFSLFSTPMLGNDTVITATEPVLQDIVPMDKRDLSLEGFSAPPGLSKPEMTPFSQQQLRISNSFPGDLDFSHQGIGGGPPGMGDIDLMNPLVDTVLGSDLLDAPKTMDPPPVQGPPGLPADTSRGLPDLGAFGINDANSFATVDEVICQFSCRCTFFSPASIKLIQVISPQLNGPLALSRSSSDRSLWVGSINVPRDRVTFQYKYLVENQLGIMWEEERQHRIVYLKTDGDTIPLEDKVDRGFVQNS